MIPIRRLKHIDVNALQFPLDAPVELEYETVMMTQEDYDALLLNPVEV